MEHEIFMQRCVDLAYLGQGNVSPNPMVGCVIVKNGLVIGEGYHSEYGGKHAEIKAIESVLDQKEIENSTVYISLEPCVHHGKTPPCVHELINRKIKTAVIGSRDSNPIVGGKGIELLKRSGIEVIENVLEEECRKLNKRFFTFHEKRRPYVILKWAQTSDGYLDKNRETDEKGINWISSPESKVLVHKWRSEEQSILVGRNTILNDNPSLTVREISGKNPTRIVIDSQMQLSKDVNIFSNDAPTLVFNRIQNKKLDGVEWIKIQETSTKYILEELYKRNIQSVLVEGGSRTLQYFIIDNVWDEARVIVGDIKFGDGVKAPIINKVPVRAHQFSDHDTIFYFTRR
ncbi:MAG: bifunctional diaminohydroxyphosphoribosylaminopyrimidine deaminase/5-amino-6-(5-phosphoribosylamino)uracil reductase RibD [Crocinitomicaceae bacterium]|nr:bifunctional diaminohydroxyphosphoribosylaminopyrimidine deaminase/5-amino-6-(5-phosphoribosylamino)uracil reductase RibD [Crocinitomicaceae bacterium]